MLAMVGAGIGGGLFLVTIVLIGELGHEIISELFLSGVICMACEDEG